MGRRKKEPRSVHRENIVSAAPALFMDKGIAVTSMDDSESRRIQQSNLVCIF
mgnify:CR=1 FL=1